ncbi:MAG: type IV pilus modification protein PilV [Betaproteobacteria bacterium]|nr:type IV pilus modification protein PilV [Betaproteobacteria bacterium]
MRPANNPLRSSRLVSRATNRQSGVGLIEILVAAAILSIGILGIVVLQVKTIADNNSALTRTQASIAAYSMFDIMRSDRANALTGAYNDTVTVGSCPNKTDTLANTQLRNWCQGFDGTSAPAATELGGLAAMGSGATGTIACSPTGAAVTASNCSITITFNDSKATGGQAAQSLTYWTQL